MELAPGTRLGRYEVLELLASGGMGEVYIARAIGPQSFQKLVALKRILPHLQQDEEFVAMFLEEARLAARLDHPNVVQVIELSQSRHGYFLTMELVHGVDLRAVLRAAAKSTPIPLGCAIAIASGLAAALHYAHERTGPDGRPMGLVHRDVSPSNVLITYDGVIKLVDFGVAKAAAHTARTRATVLKGKVGYMSPEQCRGIPVDRRTDLFSLGVLLYELTTLHRPFYEDNHFAALNRIVSGDYERPSEVVPGYPPGLEQIVAKSLEPDPARRYPTARALLDDLEQFAQAEGLRVSTAVLADYVTEQLGRPPFPAYGPVAEPPSQLGGPTVVAPAPAAAPASRTQMWLGIGLVATALMSTATLVITLTREAPATPTAEPPGSSASPSTPSESVPPGAADGSSLAIPDRAGPPEPVGPPPSTANAEPSGETEAVASAGTETETRGQTEPTSRPKARKRRRRKGSAADEPSKPSFESIFPPS